MAKLTFSKQPSVDTISPSMFLSLPTEIHALIVPHLPYPDLLSLKLTHPIFNSYPFIKTSKSLRVDWLLSRALNRLPLPTQTRCRWSTDREFVNNTEIISILRRRRKHIECAEVFAKGHSGGQCFVVEGQTCPHLVEGMEGLRNRWRFKFPRTSKDQSWKSWTPPRGPTWQGSVEALRSWQAALIAAILACVLYIVV